MIPETFLSVKVLPSGFFAFVAGLIILPSRLASGMADGGAGHRDRPVADGAGGGT
ncbi:hypothetical protein JSE7799_00609 [Jannaschia seosinensis]|uniref:Uncharacterized protein n=1 Tax=Jannaschia seosinensis TaxID=313367 RepID=A0A0M7B772_9RHOB|nr:hypothetical protein [Jannaschia seosinensis]CUH22937.1 hypothetical protein JSE7799_00609 [Jannaschia seosinensis]